MDNFFQGWAYSKEFHVMTNLLFVTASIAAIATAIYAMSRIYKAMVYVGAEKVWRSCECKSSVLAHLSKMFHIVALKTMIICYVGWTDMGDEWMKLSHSTHLLHYAILLVYIGIIGWSFSSTRHFKSLANCKGGFQLNPYRQNN